MYLKKFEYFILDSSVAGTLLLIALAIRIEAVNAAVSYTHLTLPTIA